MEFGVTFPQTDIALEPPGIRHYAETVESLGYDHLLAYDHILGVEPPHADWSGSYDYTDRFLEPFVLFGHQAAVTTDLEFMTGVLVLPQRETALVAKQAATLDVLSDGRITLGVGVGWNEREYRNLGKTFETRGARIDEQIDLLRDLWSAELVSADGDWHDIQNAGINPRPAGGSIPIWIGGSADAVLGRIARRGDGWVAPSLPIEDFEARLETLRRLLDEAGRDPDYLPIHVRVDPGEDEWLDRIEAYAALGVSHVGVGTMGRGLVSADDHLGVVADAMDDLRAHGLV